ncbi:MAG: glycerol-3-phosphate 1-O-acyltransferase PlsY [Pseudomonadota bacterium]
MTILFIFLAYLIGSISFAVLVSRAFGLPDPRSYGSHNPGATNVLRTGKKAAAILTLLGDATKGWGAVTLAKFAVPDAGAALLAAAGLAVFIGHLFPVFFRFQGGKGVATALGVLLAFSPWLGLSVLGMWITVAVVSKISSLAALVAAICAPFFATGMLGWGVQAATVAVIAALLVWRHKTNIQKLLAGTEGKIKPAEKF